MHYMTERHLFAKCQRFDVEDDMLDVCIPTPLLSVSLLMRQPVLLRDARAIVATGPAWGASGTTLGQNAYDQTVGVSEIPVTRCECTCTCIGMCVSVTNDSKACTDFMLLE